MDGLQILWQDAEYAEDESRQTILSATG